MRWFVAALLLALSACGPAPLPAKPALWQVEGPLGRKAWLFGTIHALDGPVKWRGGKVAAAFEGSQALVVEVAGLNDDDAMAETFARLAQTPGQPALSERVSPDLRDELAKALAAGKLKDSGFSSVETWAVALTLARAGEGALEAKYGVDRALIEAAREDGRAVIELEGADSQLRLFDQLDEPAQRVLLDAVVRDAAASSGEAARLAKAWRGGDMAAIEAETSRGILSDPGLRTILFTMRNEAWAARLTQIMADGKVPFVAVGAAHMAGVDGLPAMLEARGYTVKRVQ